MQEKKHNWQRKLKFKIVSPSANNIDEGDFEELVKKAENFLIENGFEYEYAELFKKKKNYLSGDAESRAKELMGAFEDPTCDIIISSQGGNNSNDILDILDYKKISENNKPFFGLSDMTVLLNVIAVKSKITTYHGLDYLWGLGKNATGYTSLLLNKFLNEGGVSIIKNPNTPKGKTIQEGNGEGIILGGCLPSFCLLFGTKYDPLEELDNDFILVFEDIGQSKSEIHSMLRQIKQHKKFQLCKGIIFGSFFFCEQKPEVNDIPIEEIFHKVFANTKIPLARIEEIGHCVENIIIPIGKRAKLECDEYRVNLSFC